MTFSRGYPSYACFGSSVGKTGVEFYLLRCGELYVLLARATVLEIQESMRLSGVNFRTVQLHASRIGFTACLHSFQTFIPNVCLQPVSLHSHYIT